MTPGYDRTCPSWMVSPWWRVCRDVGYPELDVRQYSDGSWALIQYMQSPIVPSLTRWQPVLMDIRNIEISASFIKKKADELNLERGHIWDDVAKNERRIRSEIDFEEDRADKIADAKLAVLKRAPGLMDRVMRRGMKELDPRKMLQHLDIRDLSSSHRKGLKRL